MTLLNYKKKISLQISQPIRSSPNLKSTYFHWDGLQGSMCYFLIRVKILFSYLTHYPHAVVSHRVLRCMSSVKYASVTNATSLYIISLYCLSPVISVGEPDQRWPSSILCVQYSCSHYESDQHYASLSTQLKFTKFLWILWQYL